MCGNQSCIALASVLSEEDRIALILPLFLELAEDTNWQVRYTTISHISEICALFPREFVETKFLPVFMKLMSDSEEEIRSCAAGMISKICQFLSVDVICNQILPIMQDLSTDPKEHVRVALSSDLLSMFRDCHCLIDCIDLCTLLPSSHTEEFILPLYRNLLLDTNTRVRLNLICHFGLIKEVNEVRMSLHLV